MLRTTIAICALALAHAAPVRAQQGTAPGAEIVQDTVFIQIEAHDTLPETLDAIRDLSGRLADLNAFTLASGWFAVAMGPYDRETAEALLRRLRATGDIPRDSYLQPAGRFETRVWPDGAPEPTDVAADATPPSVEAQPLDQTAAAPEPAAAEAQPEPEPRETVAEARRSEAALTRDERAELQVALEWAGYYRGAIDAAFGRGTRGAMAAWQDANGEEPTGVLTTRQRAMLLGQYNAVFDGLGFATYTDARAGIAMELPLDAVRFDRHEAPFALFEPSGDLPARVLLISQPGDRQTLNGLYEIMQTLRIVPLDGPRERDANGFTIEGRGDGIVSHTEVRLDDSAIKGFTLVWPDGDEARRSRVLERMRDSFVRLDGTLDPALISEDAQAVDLVAGLAVRRPVASGAGLFVARAGTVVTAAALVEGCARITLDEVHDMRVVATDAGLGLVALRPEATLSAPRVAQFRAAPMRPGTEIAVAGFPFGGVLDAPTLSFGTFEAASGLNGESDRARLTLSAEPGDAGGPVLDPSGAVLGLLLPDGAPEGRALPEDVHFAAAGDAVMAFLEGAGIDAVARADADALHPEDLTRLAAEMTALVSCWE